MTREVFGIGPSGDEPAHLQDALSDPPPQACGVASCACCAAADRAETQWRADTLAVTDRFIAAAQALANAHAVLRDALQIEVLPHGLAARARALVDSEPPF